MIGWGGVGLDWGWVVWLVVSFSLVPDVSNVSGVTVSNVVGDNLGATVWESNTVFSSGGVSVSVLALGKVGTRVVISNSVSVLVDSWLIIRWLVVSWLVDWGWVVWGWLVDWGWVVWGWLVDNWGWVVWGWGWVVWSWGWVGNLDWVVDNGVGNLDWVVDDWVVDDWCGVDNWVSSMGLVDSMRHNWAMSVLDGLVAGLVSHGNSQESRGSDESLKQQDYKSKHFCSNTVTLCLYYLHVDEIGTVFRIELIAYQESGACFYTLHEPTPVMQ